jgi:hypothetical protein
MLQNSSIKDPRCLGGTVIPIAIARPMQRVRSHAAMQGRHGSIADASLSMEWKS